MPTQKASGLEASIDDALVVDEPVAEAQTVANVRRFYPRVQI